MRRLVLLVLVAVAAVVALIAGPFADASVKLLSAPQRITAGGLAKGGLPITVKVPKGAHVVHVSLVRLKPLPVDLLVSRDFKVRSNRKVTLRFVIRRARALAGHGPYEVRVRAGSS